MGNYISQSDIEARYPADDLVALTDDEGTGSVVTSRVTAAITDAEAEVDAILARHGLAVPLSSPPDRLILLTCRIAWYHLHRGGVVGKTVEERYDKALEALASGAKAGTFGGTSDEAMSTTRVPGRDAPERKFTDGSMSGL